MLLLFPIVSLGQKNDVFKIDTAKILANKNLDAFVETLKTDSFQSFTNKSAIPSFLQKQLNKLARGFSIANPNQPYQCCCTSPRRLPERQLIFLAKSKNVLAMTYRTGGIGVSIHLLLIKFEKNKIIDMWTGYCWENIISVGDIIRYINDRKKEWGLNTNLMTL